MIEYPIKNTENEEIGKAELQDSVFGREIRGDLLAMAVKYQMAKRRQASANTKGRAEVAGGGKKPYRQKGTGNARQGTVSAPQYRGGGVVFGPKHRISKFKLPKKMRRLALMTALSSKQASGELILLDQLIVEDVKTKAMRLILDGLDASKSSLVVLTESDRNIELSARNLPGITVLSTEGVNVYDLMAHEKLVMTDAARKKLEERLA